jgi:hypothetical protein
MIGSLIGVVSALIVVLIGLLITMVIGLGKKVDIFKDNLVLKVDITDYKEEIKVIKFKLEGQDHKILRLQISSKVIDIDSD